MILDPHMAEAMDDPGASRAQMYLDFVLAIEAAMHTRDMSKTELAAGAGMHASQISRLMADDAENEPNVTLNTVARLAHAVGLTPTLRLVGDQQEVVVREKQTGHYTRQVSAGYGMATGVIHFGTVESAEAGGSPLAGSGGMLGLQDGPFDHKTILTNTASPAATRPVGTIMWVDAEDIRAEAGEDTEESGPPPGSGSYELREQVA